ncbi:HAMP domain-containing sensor histidine kinase [Sinanaerobacter chloroacetimidivorans]|uniref:Heme sensor protein HssS n=1 Tax=Sinanaerobacter chloroacetimidivorans TaxID=2818044 RepID=A0A8J7VZ19_9FIRM|nr:HAMP domain-containing sensor histidine kinase [Sinanaerobacter chloroacetimidivorans]MBR0597747.1 HAMP domain-containing histidine kinase [Sinanaerobacter chloroacetimidivorans]
MKTLKMKMVVWLLGIMIISCLATFIGAVFISNKTLSDEIMQTQHSMAKSLLELKSKTELSNGEIIKMTSNSMYRARIMDEFEAASLDPEIRKDLDQGEIVFVSKQLFPIATTYFTLGGDIIKINTRNSPNAFQVFRNRVALVLISSLVLSCLILTLVAGRMLRPIHRLTAATQEVAKGEFDVCLEINTKDEIGTLTKNFNQMVKELKKMEYLQKDFIRNVSHEFKTPIASIQGFARLLQKQGLTKEEQAEYSGIIAEEAERLSKLTYSILKLSKLENQDNVNYREFALDEQIRSVVVLLEPQWSRKKLTFDVDMVAVTYQGDEELLQQVWMNLIENAIKFSRLESQIKIGLSQQNGFVEVKIKDQGIGMTEETKQHIFERFYQGSTDHSVEGNGLGLSIVKRIVELCHGEIEVESKRDQGTVFTVRLFSEI